MNNRPLHHVDVFAERPLEGNQLAVVLDAGGMDPGLMQRLAREMNISETTFVMPPDDPAHAARVRIFTPSVELPFAGHPTIGTAWVLNECGLVPGGGSEFVLEEGVGPVRVRGVKSRDGTSFWLTNPQLTFGEVFSDRGAVAAAIGAGESDLLPEAPVQVVTTGNPFLFIPLRNAKSVDAAAPDVIRLAGLFRGQSALPAYVFAPDGDRRLYCRMFAGHVFGIAEDPASGSAGGPVGAFAVRYGLVPRAQKVAIVAEQGTKIGRRSMMHIEMTYEGASESPSRIDVGGAVKPVVTGTLADLG